MCPNCGQQFSQCNCPSNECVPCSRDKLCPIKLDASCIIYHIDGDDDIATKLTCLGLSNYSTLEQILEKIDDYVCNSVNIPITVNETFTAKMTANGAANHTLKTDVKVSDDDDNSLEIRPDGLFVPATQAVEVDPPPTPTLQEVTDAGHVTTRTDIQVGRLGINVSPSYPLHVTTATGVFVFDGQRLALHDSLNTRNTLIGDSSGSTLDPTDSFNVALGFFALGTATTSRSVAIGNSALQHVSGDGNTAIGYQSLFLTDFDSNVAVGASSGVANYGQKNVSIGSQAGNASIVSITTIPNSEIQVGTSSYSGSGITALITDNFLSIGQSYPFRIDLNGNRPEPYQTIGALFFYAVGVVDDANTITLRTGAFTSQGTGTSDITLFTKQDNSITIGFNTTTTASNQIRLGNTDHELLTLHNFTVDLTVAPTSTRLGRLIHDGTNYVYEKYTMLQFERDGLTPYPGRQIYNLSTNKTQTWDGTAWQDHW